MKHHLPRVFVLTDRGQAATAGRSLPEIAAALSTVEGVALVLREKDLTDEERTELAEAVVGAAGGMPVVLATGGVVRHQEFRLGYEQRVAGYHTAAGFMLERGSVAWRGLGDEPERRARLWVGKSCHGLDDLQHAVTGGANYVTLSPVFPTPSKPDYGPPLGTDGLLDLVDRLQTMAADQGVVAPVVYALGGIDERRVASCVEAGAHGVAVMGAVMTAPDPAATAHALVDAVARARAKASA